MQVSGRAGSRGYLHAQRAVLIPLFPAEEWHSGRAAGYRGPSPVADAKLHGANTGGFGGESMSDGHLVSLWRGEQGFCSYFTSLSCR